jgi:sulfate permease, SulP family
MLDTGVQSRTVRALPDLTPELVRVLRGGYSRADAMADVFAGFTVAVLALPLSLAIAIGSGADPAKGLISAIVGGALISGLGGTRFQVGGPAAAFIVVIHGIVATHGYDGLLIASLMAGFFLIVAAVCQLGDYVKYVPGPVILGFTSGLGVVIATNQLKDIFGLSGAMPVGVLARIEALWAARGSVNGAACATALVAVVLVIGLRRVRPRWPGLLIAISAASLIAWLFNMPVETIGSRFGAMPTSLPIPALPSADMARIIALLPTALTMALLIGVESLLSAVTADALAGTRHRPNTEIFAQGIANIVTALFAGLPVTGVIARTGTNFQAGARTPLSGIVHALALFALVALFAPLVSYLALPSLAAVLVTVAWRLVDHTEMLRFVRAAPRDDVAVCLITALLTIFADLTVAISTGIVLAALLFMHRMAEHPGSHAAPHDPAKAVPGVRQLVFRGPLFFGQSARVADALRDIGNNNQVLRLDMSEVPLIDATTIAVFEDLADDCKSTGCQIVLAGLNTQPAAALRKAGFLARSGVTTE